MKPNILLAILIGLLSQGGCVLGRRTVDLSVPATPLTAPTQGEISIISIVDNRTFQNKPPQPDTPSIDGDVATLTPDQKAMMIGRQRNGYGGAVGDIALPEGNSVVKLSRQLIEEGLKHRGYAIASSANAPSSAVITIEEFWGWFTPGFWTVSFEAKVQCTLTIRKAGNSQKVVIHGHGLNRGQVASDANWQLAYRRAFEDFLNNFETELKKVGL